MNFDFDSLYSSKSTIELLGIIYAKHDYQPDALKAAEKILATREITDNDRRAAGFVIDESFPSQPGLFPGEHSRIETDHLNAFDPEQNPEHSKKGFTVFLTLAGIYYARIAYTSFRNIFLSLEYESLPLFSIIYGMIYIFLVPFAFYKFYKKQPFGWYVLFGENLLSLISSIIFFGSSLTNLFSFFSYANIIYLLPLLIRPAILYFLWQKRNSNDIGVATQYKNRTIFICIAIVVLIMLIISALNSGQSF